MTLGDQSETAKRRLRSLLRPCPSAPRLTCSRSRRVGAARRLCVPPPRTPLARLRPGPRTDRTPCPHPPGRGGTRWGSSGAGAGAAGPASLPLGRARGSGEAAARDLRELECGRRGAGEAGQLRPAAGEGARRCCF